MQTNITTKGNVTNVAFVGRLDTPASQEVGKAVEPVINNASGTIVLDCRQLEYISSSGRRIFLTIRKAASAQGGKVIVKGINGDIRSVFLMTGFLNLFEIED